MEKGRFSSVVERMAYRYNQLYLTPKKGISETGMYYDIVRYGKSTDAFEQENKEESPYKQISLYDNVIVSGKDLFDGKIVG